jgi:hypothetical protein
MNHQEKANNDGIIKRQYSQGAVAIEVGEVIRAALRGQKPAGDEVTGQDEEQVYPGPSGKERFDNRDGMVKKDKDNGDSP